MRREVRLQPRVRRPIEMAGRRRRILTALLRCGFVPALLVFHAGCGSDAVPTGSPGFTPVEVGRTWLRPAGEAQSGDIENPFLSTGRAFEIRRYDVPQLLCVRTDSDDFLHVPDGTTTPGAPSVFWAVPPADAHQPVLLVFHGNGLDFIEAEATLFTHEAPRLASSLLATDLGMAGYVEILNRNGALRVLKGESRSAHVADALERGWGIVIPGNCWGDGGHHSGEIIDYYIRGARWGRVMDDEVWRWFRDQFPHDRSREYSYGCSGGGQRTAQLLLSDPHAVAASGIDSPADYLPGFKEDPPALFELLSSIPGYLDILDGFYLAHYGSFENAAAQSLGTQMLSRGIQTPIYLAFSPKDDFTTHAVTAPLADALARRQPSNRAVVWNSGEATHCQVNTRERARDVLDWLAQWRRGD